MSKSRTVYPVEGVFLNDVPHVEHECTDARCVESGAFTEKPPPKAAKTTTTPASAGVLDSKAEE
jgi:hypothetical protein